MTRPSFARISLGVFLVAFCIATGLLGSGLITHHVVQDGKIRMLRQDVNGLKLLAKEQDDTIQAMATEVDELRGEVRRAREDLEAAREAYSNASDSTTK